MNCTKEQLEQFYAMTVGKVKNPSLLNGRDENMFIPPIPVPWFRAAVEATTGRGAATVSVVWLESRLQSRDEFTIRKSITDKLGFTKRGRQTMVEHLKMMQEAGLLELNLIGKKYPTVRILKINKGEDR